MKDTFQLLCCVGGFFILAFVIVLGLESLNCTAYKHATGRETKMVFGCYIKDGSTWYSRKEFEFKQAGSVTKEK